ncbi:MAG TPA: ATP-binding protein [Kofleriaceae bacterium]|nr:ATP-binding protein [Kofleriaceae bacterium]
MTSIRARLTVALVALVAGVLVALAIALYVSVRDAAWLQHDVGLVERAQALAAIAEREDGDYELDLPAMPGTFAEAWRPDGSVLARSPGLRGDLPARTGAFDLVLPDGRDGRAFGLRFAPRDELHRPPTELALVLAEGTEGVEAAGRAVRTRFVALGLVALGLVGALTAWLLARELRPLRALTAALARIDDKHLAIRLPVAGQPAELAVPVRTLNELLERLAASFEREREFTANVSHELRTPLAGLRLLLEVSARAPEPGDHAEALAIVVQMCAVVESFLLLARVDAGQIVLARDRVALRELVDDCWRPHAAAAAGRGLAVRNLVPDDAIATTDRDKLRVVIGNLLSNAVEYTAPGGWIELTAGGGALLDVVDSGPPIPPEQLERIFDRMWRGDAARSASGLHCGIGLALARSLAGCLGLTLTADTRDDGAVRFRLAA